MKGIITDKRGQIVFVDTPGLHKPHHLLGKQLVNQAVSSIKDIEVVILIVDGTEEVGGGDQYIVDNVLGKIDKPVFLLINKLDKVPKADKNKYVEEYSKLYEFKEVFKVSARHGENIDKVIESLFNLLPEGKPFYDEDSLTDTNTRDIAGEMVREQLFRLLGDEVPHSSAIFIESYKDNLEKGLTSIKIIIYVERESQKGIVIGKGGLKLKEIGGNARKEIEELIGNKVFLELHVKVMKNWRDNAKDLKRLGYIVD